MHIVNHLLKRPNQAFQQTSRQTSFPDYFSKDIAHRIVLGDWYEQESWLTIDEKGISTYEM